MRDLGCNTIYVGHNSAGNTDPNAYEPGLAPANWYAIAAPRGTPRAIVTRLHDEIARYFTSPDMRQKMTNMGAVVDIKTADEMRKIIPAEVAKWTRVAKEAGMPKREN